MTITIELTVEEEASLKAQAEQEGTDFILLLVDVLWERVRGRPGVVE